MQDRKFGDMDLISAENNFLNKKAYDGCGQSMLDYYYLYKQDTKHELALDATGHLERFFNEYTPFECLNLIGKNENEYEHVYWLQKTYLRLMSHIACVYADYGGYYRSMLWAKKAMDIAEFFFQYDSKAVFEEYKKCTQIYELFEEFKEYFCEDEYADFLLDWEKDEFRNKFFANDNICQPKTS